MQQGPRHFFGLAHPPNAKAMEMKPTFLCLISAYQFSCTDHKDPYTHLSTFYELSGIIDILEGEEEAVYLRFFSFSLAVSTKAWLQSHPNQSLTSWSIVEEKLLNRFFPPFIYINAKLDISTSRQWPEKPICEAWERFKSLLRKCHNHGFEDVAQLSIFCNGLRPKTKMILNAVVVEQ